MLTGKAVFQGRRGAGPRYIPGVLLAVALLVGGCASLPENVTRTPSQVLPDTLATPLGRDIGPMVAAHPGQSAFHPLTEGIEAYAARLVLVQSAQRSLDLQYYIWHDDLTGRILHNGVLEAADRGVRVRLLLDDLDTAGKDQMLHLIDAHPNIEIRLFNPFANRDSRVGDFLTDTRRVNRRMHNKTLTADNQATIFGGRNIGDEYFDAAEDIGFADMDALGIGPVVDEVSQAFDLYWNSEWAYPLAAFTPGEPITEAGVAAFRRTSDAYLGEVRKTDYAVAIRALDIAEEMSISGLDYSWGRWFLVYDQPSKVEAKKVSESTHLAPSLRKAMDETVEDLIIVSPYFVPGPDFTDYLITRSAAGIRVRVLTNSLAANDVPLVHAGYMRYREDLVRGGVELYEFKSAKNENPAAGKSKRQWSGSDRASLHGKFLGFDRRYLFIGSFNLDARSVALNTELGVFFESPEIAGSLHDVFDQRAMEKGYRVTLDDAGDLQWITLENGREVRFQHEPETGFWQRAMTRFLSVFVPESQL